MIAITGATGHLGQLTIQSLLDAGTPATELVALVRDPHKAAHLAAQGVQVRHADYTLPETLGPALQGIDKLLLISASDMTNRTEAHQNVVDAAEQAEVKLLAYTSILRADTSALRLAADHQRTEAAIRASGLPFVFLRNGWYLENYNVAQAVQTGAVTSAAGNGRISAAPRADYAAAAAAVLTQPNQENKVYELGGDQAFTLQELAAEIELQSGQPVSYHNLPEADYAALLVSFGLPAPLSEILADAEAGVANGELYTDSHDLSRLIGRPTTTMHDGVKAMLAG